MVKPVPITDIDSNTVVVERAALGALTKLKEGGQGVVWVAPALRIGGRSGFVFKEYKPGVLPAVRVAQLEALVRLPAEAGSPDGDRLLASGAWPLATVRASGHPVGFVMERVPDRYWLELRLPSGKPDNPLGQFVHLLNPDQWLLDRKVPVSDHDRILLLQDAAKKLAFLHSLGIAVGDLSPKNLLFTLSGPPRCYFIDCDAMRLHGRSVLEQAETPGWEVRAVSAEELGTAHSDIYKLGLLTVRLFARDQTTRRVTDAKNLPDVLRPLALASLDPDPSNRPSAKDWAAGLRSADKATRQQVPPPVRKPPRPPAAPPKSQAGDGGVRHRSAVALGAALLALVSIGLYWLWGALGATLQTGCIIGSLVSLPVILVGWPRRDRLGRYSRLALAAGGLLGLASLPMLAALLLTKLVLALLSAVLLLGKLALQALVAALLLGLLYFWIEGTPPPWFSIHRVRRRVAPIWARGRALAGCVRNNPTASALWGNILRGMARFYRRRPEGR